MRDDGAGAGETAEADGFFGTEDRIGDGGEETGGTDDRRERSCLAFLDTLVALDIDLSGDAMKGAWRDQA
ncbi:hypothetical protein [Nocardiopsis chromatogenes]|uniref:hypothetical protein n=1 Tax=Nocardiopsis chromatogenes TaxID=280239 RepID=UPI000346734D|nr:hypothetical protein [Nocardiopsis chromatogenes]